MVPIKQNINERFLWNSFCRRRCFIRFIWQFVDTYSVVTSCFVTLEQPPVVGSISFSLFLAHLAQVSHPWQGLLFPDVYAAVLSVVEGLMKKHNFKKRTKGLLWSWLACLYEVVFDRWRSSWANCEINLHHSNRKIPPTLTIISTCYHGDCMCFSTSITSSTSRNNHVMVSLHEPPCMHWQICYSFRLQPLNGNR